MGRRVGNPVAGGPTRRPQPPARESPPCRHAAGPLTHDRGAFEYTPMTDGTRTPGWSRTDAPDRAPRVDARIGFEDDPDRSGRSRRIREGRALARIIGPLMSEAGPPGA